MRFAFGGTRQQKRHAIKRPSRYQAARFAISQSFGHFAQHQSLIVGQVRDRAIPGIGNRVSKNHRRSHLRQTM